MNTTGNHRTTENGDQTSADTTDRGGHGLAGTDGKTSPTIPLSVAASSVFNGESANGGAAPTSTAGSLVDIAKGLLSLVILCAIPVSFGALYLMFLGSIPPCSDRGVPWYKCPPDPLATTGIVLAGLAVLVAAIAALVMLWSPRKRQR
jgi:hypothetical protein